MRSATLLILLTVNFASNAQRNKLSVTSTVGVTSPLLDEGIGVHLGVNPAVSLTRKFSIEGQLSYFRAEISSSFLTGKTSSINAINALGGGRFYFSPVRKQTRFYVNGLLGVNQLIEETTGPSSQKTIDLGFATGLFLEKKRFMAGLSYESPQNVVLKGGYIFR